MYSVRRNKINMAKILLDNGASVDIENKNGITALMYCAMNKNRGLTELILQYTSGPSIDLV